MSETLTGVQLLDHKNASSILFEVLSAAVQQFPDAFPGLEWPPETEQFKKRYVALLPEFEAHRLASRQRCDIGRFLAAGILKQLVWEEDGQQQSLDAYLSSDADPFPMLTVAGKLTEGWQPVFEYQNVKTPSFRELAKVLVRRNVISAEAADALGWISDHQLQDGSLSLKGRKIVVFGAAAEMAPTHFWLASGADVLWIDRAPPPDALLTGDSYSGHLHYVQANTDLLTSLREILATVKSFSAGDPLDLCLYAYAPGQARELRLTGAMNALVNALPKNLIASVTMLVSPTTPTELSTADVRAIRQRFESRPGWEAGLDKLGLLGKGGGYFQHGEAAVTRTVVSIQGASYQAAQYLNKVIMAEYWSAHGSPLPDGVRPLRVSANTAAITKTRSLDHPVFDAAFGGAAALQVETFTPDQSQCLNALLAVYDWIGPNQPIPGRIRVHGGIHTLPYPLEYALRPAAAIGFCKSPALIGGLIKAAFR